MRWAIPVVLLLPLLACEEEVEPYRPDSDCLPGEDISQCACSRDADCDEAAGERCDWGDCVVPCATHEECGATDVCCRQRGPVKRCGPADECDPPFCAAQDETAALDRSCQPRCTSDAECPGEVCCTDGAAPVCLPDEACISTCAPATLDLARACCASIADCYALDALCTVESRCVLPPACPASVASTPRDPSAPVLWGAIQLELAPGTSRCLLDPQRCPGDDQLCGFQLWFFDPDGDAPQTRDALLARATFVRPDGTEAPVADAAEPDLANSRFDLHVCFDAGETTPSGGLRVADGAGHRSAVACVEGVAP